MEKKLVIIITKEGGMTKRELVGDLSLEKEERDFVFRDIEKEARVKGIL